MAPSCKVKLARFSAQLRIQDGAECGNIAAFNIAKHLSSESDVESLFIPKTLKPIVKKYIITYSGNYLIDMNSI